MKTKLKQLMIGVFTLSIVFTASGAMASFEKESLEVAAKNGFIEIEVNGNTVILTGFVENNQSRILAEEVAMRDGYDVINYLVVAAEGGVGFF